MSEQRQKVEQLPEQLWSLEGVQFVPKVFPIGARGTGGPVPFVATRTMLLTQERGGLLAQADGEENRPVNDDGSTECSGVDTILTAVAVADLSNVAPTPAEITASYQEALTEAEEDGAE